MTVPVGPGPADTRPVAREGARAPFPFPAAQPPRRPGAARGTPFGVRHLRTHPYHRSTPPGAAIPRRRLHEATAEPAGARRRGTGARAFRPRGPRRRRAANAEGPRGYWPTIHATAT
jgi:hypothetical protein